MTETINPSMSVELTAQLVQAYVSNNHIAPSDLPGLIATIHRNITDLSAGIVATAAPDTETRKPTAAEIRKSVHTDGIISFIDGRSYKTLKRHLTAHGLTPAQYRERFGLPNDYPMVASGYAAQRSALAKAIGLGVPGAQAQRAA